MTSHGIRWTRRESLIAGAGAIFASPFFSRQALAALAQQRSENLRVLTESPLNAEAKLETLVGNYLTPRENFYLRTNGNVPIAHEDDHVIVFEGMLERPESIKLSTLRAMFGEIDQNAVLMCAGNRRTEMGQVKKVSGTPWTTGAIGNATWTGVDLRRVLQFLGVQREAKFVWFESLDRCKMKSGGETSFGSSIPLEKALDGTTLLASQMNGKTLSVDHGAPIRAIVPGFIGARSVKWLAKVVVSDKPSPNHYVAENYKIVADTKAETLAAAEPINEYSINSLICSPAPAAEVKAGEVVLRGIALPRGGRTDRIAKVEILGRDNAVLGEAKLESPGEAFCWELWTAKISLGKGEQTLGVRATGTNGDIQPLEPNWNAQGYLFNAPHRVTFKVV